ncbi:MAG TPA: patatin-like phospholipase family protein [Bacteroidales bacterium]|nr:patatin-like phospholipase family protein [Bacteroidales bacterium]HSA44097.1 patatin-like phospholipase family protein [Bacteroidales bacterium]
MKLPAYRPGLVILLFLLLYSAACFPQKVGLVLSGGGAKGIAHIGVIKALEEQGIPIDYITGTSMGAIIGGLYASGYSPDEMLALFSSGEFQDWVSGNINSQYIFHFKKQEEDASWLNFSFNFDSLVLPSLIPANLISPHQMDYAFMEIFSGAAARAAYHFDSLMIPFRCVASDVAVNLPVVLRDGDLGSAIRASMTFPFYFKPIRINGKLLFDGGMYNNFPVDVMLADFNPDVIIGSKAASNYPPPEENNILSQLQSMLMTKTDYQIPIEKSVLIIPDLPPTGITDFSMSAGIIDSAYVSTLRAIDEIRKLVPVARSIETVKERRRSFKEKIPAMLIDSVRLMNLNRKQSRYLQKILIRDKTHFKLSDLKPQYFKVLSDDKIEAIYPTLTYEPARGIYRLNLNVEKEKNTLLTIGGNISSRPVNTAFFGARYKYLGNQAITFTANTYIGRFYSAAYAGVRMDFPSRLPCYLEADVSFNQWDYFRTRTYFFEDKTPSYLIKNDNHAEAKLGLPLGNKGKVLFSYCTAHLRNDYYQTNTFAREDTADRSFFDLGTPAILFELNSLDRKAFASSGLKMEIEFRFVAGTERYEPGSTSLALKGIIYKRYHQWYQYRMTYLNYYRQMKRLSLGVFAEMVLSNQPFFRNHTATLLASSSFEQLPDSRTLFIPSLRAISYGAFGLQQVVHLMSRIDLRLEAYVFQPYRPLIEQDNQQTRFGDPFSRRYMLGAATLVWNGPFAPVSLTLNYFESYDQPLLLTFNIGYTLFNRRALN